MRGISVTLESAKVIPPVASISTSVLDLSDSCSKACIASSSPHYSSSLSLICSISPLDMGESCVVLGRCVHVQSEMHRLEFVVNMVIRTSIMVCMVGSGDCIFVPMTSSMRLYPSRERFIIDSNVRWVFCRTTQSFFVIDFEPNVEPWCMILGVLTLSWELLITIFLCWLLPPE